MTLRQTRDFIRWFLGIAIAFIVILTLGAIGWLIPIMVFLVWTVLLLIVIMILIFGGFWLFTEEGYEGVNGLIDEIIKYYRKSNDEI